MASYKYKQGGSGEYIYVQYNIVPDIGTPLEVGQEVTISGNIRAYSYALQNIKVMLSCSSYGTGIFEDTGNYEKELDLNISVARNSNKNFKITFIVGREYDDVLDENGVTIYPIDSPFHPSFTENSEKIYIRFFSNDIYTSFTLNQYLIYKNPDDAPKIDQLNVVRSKLIDGKYAAANDGTNLLVINAIGTGDSTNAVCWIQIGNISGDVDYTTDVIRNIFSKNGYSESSPRLFKNEIPVAENAEFTFVILNENGHASAKVTIEKAFANFHLSGAKNGGACFGGFSDSTDDEPKLESYYKGYFYNGFSDKTIKMIGNVLYPVDSIYICTGRLSPYAIFGGEWERIEGRFLVASGGSYNSGSTGGSPSYSLSVSHKHLSPVGFSGGRIGAVNINDSQSTGNGRAYGAVEVTHSGTLTSNTVLGYTANATVSATIPTIPPYIAVDVYRRTALYDIENDV